MAPIRRKKRARTSTSKSRHVVPPPPEVVETYGIEFSKELHWDRFIQLTKRKLKSTRFYDQATTKLLGIDEDVRLLAKNLGLLEFLDLNAPTYARLTFEFLFRPMK